MEKIGDMNLCSLGEFIDEEIGVAGTPERMSFDAELNERLAKEKKTVSYHIMMSRSLRKSVTQKANALGQSVS